MDKKSCYGLYMDDEYYGISDEAGLFAIIKEQLENIEDEQQCEFIIRRVDLTNEEFENLPEI